MARVILIDLDRVLDIHTALTDEFRGSEDAIAPEGVKDQGMLESAVNRPRVAAAKYPTVPTAGAALVHGIIQNHPFYNGNKRTALIALVWFLQRLNDRYLLFSEDQVYGLIVSLADHSISKVGDERHNADREVLAASQWISRHTATAQSRNTMLKWHHLERILTHFGCTVVPKTGNSVLVRRGPRTVSTGRRNPGEDMERKEIVRIRTALELDARHGIDSQVFYERGPVYPRIEDVIDRYRGVLHRLALLDRSD